MGANFARVKEPQNLSTEACICELTHDLPRLIVKTIPQSINLDVDPVINNISDFQSHAVIVVDPSVACFPRYVSGQIARLKVAHRLVDVAVECEELDTPRI